MCINKSVDSFIIITSLCYWERKCFFSETTKHKIVNGYVLKS